MKPVTQDEHANHRTLQARQAEVPAKLTAPPSGRRIWPSILHTLDLRMSGKLSLVLTRLSGSLWLLPSLLVLILGAVAAFLVQWDRRSGFELASQWPLIFVAEPEGARSILTVVATSMATIAGVAFSITVVALSLAATQYTSRVLGTFMKDRVNQVIVGLLAGIFVYCLIVLRAVRSGDEAFMPALGVLIAIVLAFVGIMAFVYFIHNTATSIRASHIVFSIATDTIRSIDAAYPDPIQAQAEAPDMHAMDWRSIHAQQSGFVQAVDLDSLGNFAESIDGVVRMELGVGDFALEGSPLVSFHGQCDDEAAHKTVIEAYALGWDRTIEQDPAFGLQGLKDIALKALSPAVNDTMTALMCVDQFGAVLSRLGDRHVHDAFVYQSGKLRLMLTGQTYASLADLCFDEVRHHGHANPAVLLRILSVLRQVGRFTREHSRRTVLAAHARVTIQALHATGHCWRDRGALLLQAEQTRAELEAHYQDRPGSVNAASIH